IDYEELPANVSAAMAENSERIWPEAEGNICFSYQLGDCSATETAFAHMAHIAKLRILNNRLSANPLEPRGALGLRAPRSDRFTLYSSRQAQHRTREILCRDVFQIPEIKIRIVAMDVGGGFGMKGPVFPEESMVPWAAKKVGRAVKWIAERSESLVSDMH